jgi:replicative DNA helicase Mcm
LDGDTLVFEHPTDILREHYEGDMVRIKNKQVDLLVTPNHKLYLQRAEKWGFEPATDAAHGRPCFKKDAVWAGTRMDNFVIAGETVPAADWLDFMGYFIAQGFVSSHNRVGIYGKGLDGDRIGKCLARLPFLFWIERGSNGTDSLRTKNKRLHALLASEGRSWERHIPRELLELPPDQLRILLDALIHANGKTGYSGSLLTTSRRLADDLQEALLKTGMAGGVAVAQPSLKGKNKRTLFRVNINQTRLTPQINKRRKSVSIEQYRGEIFCCTVRTGLVYVRRNGVGCWSGNSDRYWSLALALLAGKQPPIEYGYESVGKAESFGL